MHKISDHKQYSDSQQIPNKVVYAQESSKFNKVIELISKEPEQLRNKGILDSFLVYKYNDSFALK